MARFARQTERSGAAEFPPRPSMREISTGGEGIFARPRFLPRSERKAFCYWGSAAEFRISLCEMRRQEKESCACPAHPCAHNRFTPFVLYEK